MNFLNKKDLTTIFYFYYFISTFTRLKKYIIFNCIYFSHILYNEPLNFICHL